MAKDYGVLIAISTDAHDATQMGAVITYGVATARRGWLEAKDVVNTRGFLEMKELLKG
jgi:DNA polymerase (family 10)